ncbi:LemA family protein [Salisaeta longa]|uniref:LemA family protein n=1 Tax=Salisaeta longa TaxID=503170 RepID=UPI0003B6447E|nr:LemA family protein [Salisaeta longa]
MRSKGTLVLVALVALLGLGGCAGVSTYNDMIAAQENVKQAWANVESNYQRRADLIPNLVNTVQGAANFEQETLQRVIEARSKATSIQISADDLNDPQKLQQYQAAQQALGQSLGRLLAVSERYPQLQATGAFRDLQAQLEGTENRINVARRDYNAAVQRYNTQIRRFPANIVANLTGFEPRAPFEADPGAAQPPAVDFGS